MTPEEVGARTEICEVMARYCRAVDSRRFELFDGLFTPDATVDYSASGGIAGTVAEAQNYLADALVVFTRTQHMLGLPAIDLDGDRATAVVPCHNPMVMGEGSAQKVLVCALWYHLGLRRMDGSWRIDALRQESCHMTFVQGQTLEVAP